MRSSLLVAAVAVAFVACAPRAASTRAAAAPPKIQMRTYELVLLRRGPAWTAESTPETKRLFAGHMANIVAMAKARKLLVAGPFEAEANDANALAGIFLFDVTDVSEIKTLLANDPAIAAGRFVPEFHTWYGPVGVTYEHREELLKSESGLTPN